MADVTGSKKRIIVIGGGFAGVKCAKKLRQLLHKDECEIVLFASENHMVFHPLLAEVASATINPKDMAAPLRLLLPHTQIRMEEVNELRLASNEVVYEDLHGGSGAIKYDQLVIACGTASNLSVIPGMPDHAFPMKTVGDALALQYHVINQMECAETCSSADEKKRLLTVVVVGGGFSGVEVAGEIYDFMTRSARYYANFSESEINVTLVHSRGQILPEVGASLREFAKNKMELNGIKFVLNSGASYCTKDGVGLKDGQFVEAGTVICTIGTRPAALVDKLDVVKEHGRIAVNADMSVPDFENVWAIGDCAAVPNALDGQLSPTTAQFAERQGAQLAKNIRARLSGRQTKPFHHKSLGTLCSIGGKSAVAEVLGVKLSGTLAWMTWRATYLIKLPSFVQQLAVLLTWTLGFLFPPALTGPRIDRTRNVGSAYFKAGDWIFKEGEPASEFYAIQDGEVEIIKKTDGEENVVAVLGKDDFFGEGALVDRRNRRNSCRARTDLQLLVLGRDVFAQVSKSLAPLRKAVALAIQQRQGAWEEKNEVQKILATMKLSDLIRPIPATISESNTLDKVLSLMDSYAASVLYVIDESEKLVGVITNTDLLNAVESNLGKSIDVRKLEAKTYMITQPICAAQSDDTTMVAMTMYDHDFKRLPIVDSYQSKKLIGFVRAEDILSCVTEKLISPNLEEFQK
ncbi:MAG: FAD-dependent oxidoreductase [Candidatus Obscuribacterales bacterium]|nr:FAD-dependent oxidoreductase [Candidatus Obscuribacterales bacterium]